VSYIGFVSGINTDKFAAREFSFGRSIGILLRTYFVVSMLTGDNRPQPEHIDTHSAAGIALLKSIFILLHRVPMLGESYRESILTGPD
jgi:hypothetical protein